MKRRNFLRCIGTQAMFCACGGYSAMGRIVGGDNKNKPNILFIFADDQCFETIRALGNDEIETPNLDKLVRGGVTFTHAYNQGSWTGAVCIASRTMLNTGRFLWNAKKEQDENFKDMKKTGRFWGTLIKNAGYETYMTGKWHIRKAPAENIFDHTKDIRPGMPKQTKEGYDRPHEGQPDKWSPYDKSIGGYWEGGEHWSEVLVDDAKEFLAESSNSDKPFFMYLAFNAAHDPRQSPKEYVDKYPLGSVKVPKNFQHLYPNADAIGCGPTLRDERLAPFPRTEYAVKVNRQEYYALITHMDVQIGRILDALKKSGKLDNTYIFFTADQGLAVGHHGLMGKQNMYDHSVRVPLMVCGPGIPKNKKIDTPVYLQDIMPSTLELAGVEKPADVQFKSLLPLIRGERKRNYDAVYGGYKELQRMVTMGGYKLIMYPNLKKCLLFNLKKDPLEMNNLAADAKYRPIIEKLFARFVQLQKETGDDLKIDISEYTG
ncbi:MAG: sulfatase-like hydrolase/transferase [Candidatus Hydrogenedentes bacterium]|nr:sulfatase-like hydrolase/transferase [Candidatus Hydrogenedentota bacterium]